MYQREPVRYRHESSEMKPDPQPPLYDITRAIPFDLFSIPQVREGLQAIVDAEYRRELTDVAELAKAWRELCDIYLD